MKRLFVLIIFLSIGSQLFSQVPKDINLYLFKKRYNKKTWDIISKKKGILSIDILSGFMIDPKKDGSIFYESVSNYLSKIYPQIEDKGLLCINLENQLFQNLKLLKKDDPRIKHSLVTFVSLIKYVKKLRPNVKIGIYGLPIRTFHVQENDNSDRKLDAILSNCDYIMPSLYIIYPDKQITLKRNYDYLKQNLDQAFSYGARLKKPVLPFVWYLVHPINKKYGYEMLSPTEMKRYITFIKQYKYKNLNTVGGIIWWETPTPYRENKIRTSNDMQPLVKLDCNDVLMNYMNHIL
ncbi:hypothetical protein WG904_10375 [Pedobacter sp. Du54]|uniref:hypothetical protein n=1 Tax=Pedobacter anseongensis TaxID=3133439 RepID=UPI0030B061DD